ncbi:MAG: hypothetical protein H6862_02980 [Rhodospirillales bacterium]|nr:hypothetical protein [Rhodospirillales bacterium]
MKTPPSKQTSSDPLQNGSGELYGPWQILPTIPDDEVMQMAIGGEDLIRYMYKDTRGNVTVGAGRHLPDRESAQTLPFGVPVNVYGPIRPGDPTHTPVTPEEIGMAYDKVKALPYGQGKGADYYNPAGSMGKSRVMNIELPEKEARRILKEDLITHAVELERKFPDLHDYPPSAQKGLLDMHYNLGGTQFSEKNWPMLFDAAKKGDWETVARESRRNGIGDKRNRNTKDLFHEALEKR